MSEGGKSCDGGQMSFLKQHIKYDCVVCPVHFLYQFVMVTDIMKHPVLGYVMVYLILCVAFYFLHY